MKRNVIIVILIILASALLGLVACDKQELNTIEGTWQGNSAKYTFTDKDVFVSTVNPDFYCKGVYIVNKNTLELSIGYSKTTYSYRVIERDTLYLVTEFKHEYKLIKQ